MSINWNNNSVRENREVAVVLEGEDPASYYREVFVADWRGGGGGGRLPVGVVAVAAFAVLLGVAVARRRIEFADGTSVGGEVFETD
ncbi:phospholipase D-like domain-containing protein [Halogranum amylolyticum]|uniref:hypothetical protein n=1 Tax=Halogranum amylolyticum TaxID=660520 RepID=UPI000B7C9A20|nr:hypothetical protein [Halogranum amylolyticum]